MTEIEPEIEREQPPVAPAATPEPEPEPVDFCAIVRQHPSRTKLGMVFIGAEVRGRISGRRSMREREIPADVVVWLTSEITNYRTNGPEVGAQHLRAGIEGASVHTIVRCRCDECQSWRAGRFEIARFFGLLE